MKKLILVFLMLAVLVSLTACSADPNAGVYNAVSCTAMGFSMDCAGDFLELKGGGRGSLRLMGEDYICSWELEGETITVKNHGDEFTGTLHNGMITVDFSGVVCVYRMDAVEEKDGTVRGHIHRWQEADCVNAEICAECGDTQGEPLGHTSTPANHQDPAVCTVCGEITGDRLEPDMEKYGITEFMEVGGVYPYKTILTDHPEETTVGEVEVLGYEIVDSAEGYPAREGYEWRMVKLRVSFWGKQEAQKGVSTATNVEDYYNIYLLDDTLSYEEETGDSLYQIRYHGELMDVRYKYTVEWTRWKWKNNTKWVDGAACAAFCVPKGYDGAVFGYRNKAVEWPDGTHLPEVYNTEDFLLFRLN